MRIPTLGDATRALSFFSATQQRFSSSGSNSDLPTTQFHELPGGSPLSLCPVSRSADLFNITSVELTKQPVYFDDFLTVHIYGGFRETWSSNATINTTIDCGSHCEMYGNPPGERPSASFSLPFCNVSDIDQPLGGKKKSHTCPPEAGHALISSPAYVWPMFLRAPGWYNFTFDARTAEGERIYCLTTEVCLRWEDPQKNEHYPKGPWSDCRWPR